MIPRLGAHALFMAALVACASPPSPPLAAAGQFSQPDGYEIGDQTARDFRISPLDKISITVFGQEKLSAERLQVDASGQIVMPLIGGVMAAGKTAQQLSAEIAARLGEKYLQSPHVSVNIDDAVGQNVTVSGAVVESGVYPIKGSTTLMQAVAMAKGPDIKIANLKRVIVFRKVNGRRAAAQFNLVAIRNGEADDPEIFGGDSIVVDTSGGKSVWREVVSTLPGFGIFAYF